MKDNSVDNVENGDTTAAIATNEDSQQQQRQPVIPQSLALYEDGNFNLAALPVTDQLEIVRDIMTQEAALESMLLPMVRSRDIVGIPLNVLDAAFKDIRDEGELKTCVSFVCEYINDCEHNGPYGLEQHRAGESFTCLKSSNTFNDIYANRFSKLRGIAVRPILNMNFVVDTRWVVAGNPAVVLRPISMAAIAAGK